jgi:hypothetical protein
VPRGIVKCQLPIFDLERVARKRRLSKIANQQSKIGNRKYGRGSVPVATTPSKHKRRLTNARPEADFRYRSNCAARTRSESATYVFKRAGFHFGE